MQTIQPFKTISLIARLKKRKSQIEEKSPLLPTYQPSEEIKPKTNKIEKPGLSEFETQEFSFNRLQLRIAKRLTKLQQDGNDVPIYKELISEFSKITPMPQKKAGIMDNIGNIFECEYSIPLMKLKHQYENNY